MCRNVKGNKYLCNRIHISRKSNRVHNVPVPMCIQLSRGWLSCIPSRFSVLFEKKMLF